VDKTIRRNEVCVIGLPRCDFVFSSTRTCFIAYGSQESTLEMTIIRSLLEKRGIQPVEAGGMLAPAQNAYCAKICSKIIVSQFCVVLLNNEESKGIEIPNANVNMEYGLMLGFNKYVIPFQRASQKLPFNVAGLDTIKYTNSNFERLARDSIDHAIRETQQDAPPPVTPDQLLEAFLLSQRTLIAPLNTDGDRAIFQLGQPLGFNLLNDFSGLSYTYFGNFTMLRPEVIAWRVKMLAEILDGRRAALLPRVQAGMVTSEQAKMIERVVERINIWIVVTSPEDKQKVKTTLSSIHYAVRVFSIADIGMELDKLGAGAS
jgi:hypothetical protein